MKASNATKQALIFLATTLALSFFVFWGPLAFFRIPTISFVSDTTGPAWAIALFIFGGFVPSLVAVLLTWIWEGSGGLRRLGRRVVQFKLGWRAYLAATGFVVAATLGQILIIRLLGQPFDASQFVRQLGSFLPLLILGPLSEELGWRGYAQERLQARFTPLAAALIVGVVWALWHLPLFYLPGSSQSELNMPFLPFLLTQTSASVLYAWLYNFTGGSIWSAIFLHWIQTYANQVVATGVTRTPAYNWLEFVPYFVLAVLIAVVWRRAPR